MFIFGAALDPPSSRSTFVPLFAGRAGLVRHHHRPGSLGDELTYRLTDAGLLTAAALIPQLPNEQVHVYYHACDAFCEPEPE